jgi:RNA polymerase sigma factor (sigma-70 family)
MSDTDTAWPEATKLTSLVREAQKHEGRSLETLLVSLRPAFVRYFSRRLAPENAEDLAQNALIRVAGALHRIDPERADGYVATVARNLLRTAYRRRAIEAQRIGDIEWLDVTESHETSESQAELKELVRAVHRVANAALAPELADIIRGLLHGETPAEIARRQNVSPVTIRTRLLRARAVLRKELVGYIACSGRERCVVSNGHNVTP